jgi:hypothetical protein
MRSIPRISNSRLTDNAATGPRRRLAPLLQPHHDAGRPPGAVETAKLYDVSHEAHLRDTPSKIADGHPISRIDEFDALEQEGWIMLQFDAAPAIPLKYPHLTVLTSEEVEQGRVAGYLAEIVDPREPVRRAGLDNYAELPADDDLQDWRTRIYVIWFCYVYENFLRIDKPLYAIEELILEFKAPDVLDTSDRRLATLYAGAGGWEPVSHSERARQLEVLKPHYAKAISLLDNWKARGR